MFEPEFAEAVESGDMFACQECHDFLSDEIGYCPTCHIGECESCGDPVLPKDLGRRDFEDSQIIVCRACVDHENGIPSPCATPAVIRFHEALKNLNKPPLSLNEKNALSLLR